jgi:chromosome segregation protein
MLKALELIGFKSFADKTRFEFPPGITVVVGPNGSGKSNVVDAIKWVLGEQSAKSLRGREMADMIFTTDSKSSRRQINTAEATIVFDNTDRTLSVDSDEVEVTRRVYRSGEGEYLINRQPCRLKDVRDLFRGTGVGADAYSLIEQGKVEELLNASPRDRRAIFEEAAGISRFKAKKIEAQRRLERVDQNLVRLSDIVDEVESRLRSVRSQAGKARRYREQTERLQQLRTQVGMTDWRELSDQIQLTEDQLTTLRDQAGELGTALQTQEQRQRELDQLQQSGSREILELEAQMSGHREQIAARQSTVAEQRQRLEELEQQFLQFRGQRAMLSSGAVEARSELDQANLELADWEQRSEKIASRLEAHRQTVQRLENQLQEAGEERDKSGAQLLDQAAQLATTASQLKSVEQDRVTAAETSEVVRVHLTELGKRRRHGQDQLGELINEEQGLAGQLENQADQLTASEREVSETRRLQGRRQEEAAEHQSRLSGVRERYDLLAQLERDRDGVAAGVQYVIEQAEQQPTGHCREFCGLVADLIEAPLAIAPLIDLVLGGRSQHVVMRGAACAEALEQDQLDLPGRVGILQLDSLYEDITPLDLAGEAGVINRADRMVEVRPGYEKLAQHMLASCWVVKTLAEARQLSSRLRGRVRLVTLAGELLEENGTLHVGQGESLTGLISRRSELRALEQELAVLRQHADQSQLEVQRLEGVIDFQDEEIRELNQRRRQWNSEMVDVSVRTQSQKQLLVQIEVRQSEAQQQLREALGRQQSAKQARLLCEEQYAQLQQNQRELDQQIQRTNDLIERLGQQREQEHQRATDVQVELATSDQQLTTLRVRQSKCEQAFRDRSSRMADVDQQLQQLGSRLGDSVSQILAATSRLAKLYLDKELLQQRSSQLASELEQGSSEREELVVSVQQTREQTQQLQQEIHQHELALGEHQLQRTNLQQRMRDDYGVEIGEAEEVETDPQDEEDSERQQVDEEIAGLREKISNAGAVNMEALDELDELDTRFQTLSSQFQDLSEAKQTLERIIQRINSDSRRLLAETIEIIRGNFAKLYRKVFGGGEADIVLEGDDDVLEAGVNIITKPPGKPPIHMSLLSGGERALSAASLLLAIFQFRPSPFCVLDEVDAPFDEANKGRFIAVLKDFLDSTRFVVVTHSKKTMTAADTLYGVTMQESGVSKQVSVRFEDVTNDGHIKPEALERSIKDQAA